MVEYFSKSAVRGDENVSTCTIILIQKSPEGKDMTDIYDIILIFTGLLALTVNRAQEQNTVNILANFILSQRQYRASCVLYNSNVSLYSGYLLFIKIVHHSNQTIHSVTRYPALSKQWVYHITCLRVCLSTNIIKLLHSCKLTSLHHSQLWRRELELCRWHIQSPVDLCRRAAAAAVHMSELAAAPPPPAGADKLGLDIFPHITILHILRSHYKLCQVTIPPPAHPRDQQSITLLYSQL